MPVFSRYCRISWRICACSETSSIEVGSSMTSRSGLNDNTRIRTARWISPPLTWDGYRSIRSMDSLKVSRSFSSLASLCFPGMPSLLYASKIDCLRVINGLKASSGCWNRICIPGLSFLNSFSRIPVMFSPLKNTSPREGGVSFKAILPMVVLPDPLLPSSPRIWFFSILKEISSRARKGLGSKKPFL